MPETRACDCYTITDYNGEEIIYCTLHARAAEMRELLAQTPTLLNPEGRRETEWVVKVMALLEETKHA